MQEPESYPADLQDWLDAVVDDRATPAQLACLERCLATDPASRAFYLRYIHLHAQLQWRYGEEWDDAGANTSTGAAPYDATSGRLAGPIAGALRARWLPLAAALAMMLGFGAQRWPLSPRRTTRDDLQASASVQTLATLNDAADCLWHGCRQPTAVGSRLAAGRLRLDRGLAEIVFDRGARLILKGPAVLDILSNRDARLGAGMATITIPHQAIGFTILTPSARVVDKGTAFGVDVDVSGSTKVFTFDGVVEVHPLRAIAESSPAAPRTGDVWRVTAGQCARVTADGLGCRMVAGEDGAEFVRRLRPRSTHAMAGASYADVVLADQPNGYWRFEDNVVCDSHSAADSSDWQHGGRYHGRVTAIAGVPGIGGQAVHFDGNSARVCVPHRPDLACDALSVEFWLRTHEVWSHTYWPGDAVLVQKVVPDFAADWAVVGGSMMPGKKEGRVIVGIGASQHQDHLMPSPHGIADDAWHHVVWTRDVSGRNVLYIDGAVAARTEDGGSAISNLRDIDIGGSITSASLVVASAGQAVNERGEALSDRTFLCGDMDEVAIYTRVLEPTRVRAHYEKGRDGR